MEKSKAEFARRLREAMAAAGYEAKPAVLEREFNQRYWGKAMTLHGVRRWLRGETLPAQDKLLTLAEWLGVEPQALRFGNEVAQGVRARRKRWERASAMRNARFSRHFCGCRCRSARRYARSSWRLRAIIPPPQGQVGKRACCGWRRNAGYFSRRTLAPKAASLCSSPA